jgi:hypothetical protein
MLNENQIEALRMFDRLSGGSFDAWALAGPHNAKNRAAIMTAWHGRKIPQAKAGVTAIRQAMYETAKPTGDCLAARETAFAAWAKQAATQAEKN